MHRSRLSTILIDTPLAEAEVSAAFWSAALGLRSQRVEDAPEFTSLANMHPDFTLAVQAVDDAPRMHVDIETDDVQAECARLVALGAIETHVWDDCHTFRVPGGQLACVIPLHSDAETFTRLAHVWE